VPGPRLWEYESAADRANRLRQEKAQQSSAPTGGFSDWASRVDSTIGLAPEVAPITRPQPVAAPAQVAPAPQKKSGGLLSKIGSGLGAAVGMANEIPGVGAAAHLGNVGLQKMQIPSEIAQGAVAAPFGRLEIDPATGQPRREFSVGSALGGLAEFGKDLGTLGMAGASRERITRENALRASAGQDVTGGGLLGATQRVRREGQSVQDSNLPAGVKTGIGMGLDPSMWIGPGAVKGAFKFLPEAVTASKGFRAGAGLLESPAGASVGSILGSAGAAQLGENENLSPGQRTALTLGGGLLGGVIGGSRSAQKALQGKGPLRGMGGSIVDPLGPKGEAYMQAGARHGVDVFYDDNGFAAVADPRAALAKADELQAQLPVLNRPSGFGETRTNNNFFGESRTTSTHEGDLGRLEFTRDLTPEEEAIYGDVRMIRGLAADQIANPMPDPLMEEPWLTNEHYEPRATEYSGPNSPQARKGIKDAEEWVRRQISPDRPLGETLYLMKRELREGGRVVNAANPKIGELAYYGRLDELIRNFSADADAALARQHGLGKPVAPAESDLAAGDVGGAPKQAAVGTPTVKRVDLEGNVIDTFQTEAELNGIRQTQGAMDLTGRGAQPVTVYHGTAGPLRGGMLEPDAFVTTDPKAAAAFAAAEARLNGGEPQVYAFEAQPGALKPTGVDDFASTAGGAQLVADPSKLRQIAPSQAAESAPAVPPGSGAAPPPASPPPPTAGMPPPPGGQPPRPRPTPARPTQTTPFDLGPLAPAPLSRRDEWMNTIKRTLGVGVEENSYSSPVMRFRRTAEPVIKSHADRIAAIIPVIRDRAFRVDKYGRISDLPGQPTIQDVAARLPEFAPVMHADQLAALNQIRAEIEPYTEALKAFGIEHGARADVIEGGFYIPRGNAALEGADAPRKVGNGRGSAGGKTGAERHAKFVPGENDLGIESMSDAIANGYEYASLEEALRGHVRETGRRVTDKQVADYFKALVDEEGNYIGETSFDHMNPAVRAEYQAAKKLAARVQGRMNTALKRAGMATGKGDELASVLERQATGAAQRASAGAESATEIAARMDAMRNRVTPPPRTAEAATNEINTLQRFITRSQDRIYELRQRGGRHADEAGILQQQLDAARQRLENVEPRYKRAIDNSRQTPREQGRIGLSGLEQHTFPDAIANAANKYLRNEKPPSGQGAVLLNTTAAFNNLLRGLKASMDISFTGIQGLVGAVHHPVDYGRAMVLAWKSMGDPQALGKYLLDFDAAAAKNGGMTSRQWIDAGLHVGGADTEFAIGRGLPAIGEALGKGGKVNPIRGSNRAFGYFGDVLRMELADTAYRNAAAHGFDMTSQVNLRSVADVANNATGWSPNAFGGTTGQLAMFAPRFFQSQLDLIAKAATERTIAGDEARMMLTKLIGTGTILTVAANEAGGRPIPYEELFDPRSSNFMRIRIDGQDVSLFGPWDSLLRGISNAAQGDVTYMARTKASPAMSMAWDLITGDTFTGENARTPGEVLRNLLPFSLAQSPEAIMSAAQGDLGGLGREAIGTTGLKATPMTPNEQLDTLSRATYGKPFYDLLASQQEEIKTEHPDLWQRAVERKSSQAQRFELLKGQYREEQTAADAQLVAGTLAREDWKDQYDNRRQQMFGAGRALFDNKAITNPKTPEQRYIQIIESHKDAAGAIDWDKVDTDVAALSPEDQAYIDDRQGLGSTPVVKAYKRAAAQRSEMFALPKYAGFTADEARAVDDLWVQVRANASRAEPGPMLVSLRKLLEDGRTVDPKVLSGVRRRIVGTMRTLRQRERYALTHPEMVAFYGGAGKAGPLTPAERAALRG